MRRPFVKKENSIENRKPQICYLLSKINSYLLFLCFILLILHSNCAEPESGCLDVFATNYNVTADESCCDDPDEICCCAYTQFVLSIDHKLESDTSLNFDLDDPLRVDANPVSYFSVSDVRFYLSNIRVVDSNGQSYSVQDSLQIQIYDGASTSTVVLTDNVILVKESQFNYTVGTFEPFDSFDTLQVDALAFTVGLANPWNDIVYETLPEDHLLSSSGEDSLYISSTDGFVFNQMRIRKDLAPNSKGTSYSINEAFDVVLPFISPQRVYFDENLTINLRINYLDWFTGINFATDTDEEILNSIKQNTIHIFELKE